MTAAALLVLAGVVALVWLATETRQIDRRDPVDDRAAEWRSVLYDTDTDSTPGGDR